MAASNSHYSHLIYKISRLEQSTFDSCGMVHWVEEYIL